MSTDLMVVDALQAIDRVKAYRDIIHTMREQDILIPGVDFGVIPGSSKPSLLKPGAERLCSAFGLCPKFVRISKEENWAEDAPLFHYEHQCRLVHIETGKLVATANGSCNSKESKYRWRWVNASEIPPGVDISTLQFRDTTISEFQFAVDKRETSGQYGKPAEYWDQFEEAIKNTEAIPGTRKTSQGNVLATWEIPGKVYRIPNDDIFSQVNTILKMSQKRALIAATLIATNASDHFTQDIEDMPGFGIVEGEYAEDTPPEQAPALPKQRKNPNPPASPDQAQVAAGTRKQVTLFSLKTRRTRNGGWEYTIFTTRDENGRFEKIVQHERGVFKTGGYVTGKDWQEDGYGEFFKPQIPCWIAVNDKGNFEIEAETFPPFDPGWTELNTATEQPQPVSQDIPL